MTAEVAVLNSHGVALAADSAITLGQDATKIYTSADKLFQLHQSDPVGIMVYGNANIVGMPWETVIKAFRFELGAESFDQLSGYFNRFIEFLKSSPDIFSHAREDQAVGVLAYGLLIDVRNRLEQRLDDEAAKREGLSDQEVSEICEDEFAKRLEVVRARPLLNSLEPSALAKVRAKYSSEIVDLKKEIFGALPMRKATSQKLTALVVEMLCRWYFGPRRGGVVIAGFGRRQYLPELMAFEIEEFVLGKPRIRKEKNVAISSNNAGSIVPFAQQEMVHSFMEGADRELMQYMTSSVRSLFGGAIDAIVEHVGAHEKALAASLRKSVASVQSQALEKLFADWGAKRDGFWQPVLQIVASLPKDELAAMAEALVNLTKFRRRVTAARETVGGPIDVAVITKGDGFVWIRRKHYFPPELNPRAIARYGKG